MKISSKIAVLLSLSASVFSASAFAESQIINFNAGYFYSSLENAANNNYMTSGKVLLVADTSNSGFSSLLLNSGSSLATGNYLNGGTDYYIFGSASISSSGMSTGMAAGQFTVDLSSDLAGKDYAMIILSSTFATDVATVGDTYGVFSPTFVKESGVDPLSDGDAWTVPTSSKDYYTAFAFTAGASGAGYLPNTYTATDKKVTEVPEPSTYALIFGALAIAFVAYKRRK